MNTVNTAANTVYIKSSATYTETANVVTKGAASNWIIYEGYDTTPGDGGIITIDGESTRAQGLIDTATGNIYNIFRNIKVQNTTDDGWQLDASVYLFVNCHADNCGAHGFDQGSVQYINCTSTNNGIDGWDSSGSHFYACVAAGNTGHGYDLLTFVALYQCLAYGNGNGQIFNPQSGPFTIVECTVDGDNIAATEGISCTSTSTRGMVLNCIIYDCGVGGDGPSGAAPALYVDYVGFSENATNRDATWTVGPNDIIISGDPFVNSAARDYRLHSTNGAAFINAGRDQGGDSPGMDLGALQTVDAGAAGPSSDTRTVSRGFGRGMI